MGEKLLFKNCYSNIDASIAINGGPTEVLIMDFYSHSSIELGGIDLDKNTLSLPGLGTKSV